MPKRLTKESFITKAKECHGGKYNYDDVVYVNNRTPIRIYCTSCNSYFFQRPNDHLRGKGCKICGIKKNKVKRKNHVSINNRTTKFGDFVNDYDKPIVDNNGHILVSYQKWLSMLNRCYSKKYQKNQPTYIGCSVCNEWKFFSNFKKWFDENYIDNCELDKDIIIKGNKIYSPKTCCFVPKRINAIILRTQAKRGNLPMGVSLTRHGKYQATCTDGETQHYLGIYNTPKDAFNAYKEKKLEIIRRESKYYYSIGGMSTKTYNALLNYNIDIND